MVKFFDASGAIKNAVEPYSNMFFFLDDQARPPPAWMEKFFDASGRALGGCSGGQLAALGLSLQRLRMLPSPAWQRQYRLVKWLSCDTSVAVE